MKTIRHNVFETNSSSEHVVTLLQEPEYEQFKNGESYYSTNDGLVNLDDWKKWRDSWSSERAKAKDEDDARTYPDSEWAQEKLNDSTLFKELSDESLNKLWKYAVTDWKKSDEGIINCNRFDKDDVKDEWSEAEIRFMERVLEDNYRLWNFKSWGYGFECSNIDSIVTPHGDKVYAISYSGYGD